MSLDQAIAVFSLIIAFMSAVISFSGVRILVKQLRDTTQKQEMDSEFAVYDNNRQLLSLGFFHPQLFDVLEDSTHVDPHSERYYVQLWLNQFAQIHAYHQRAIIRGELKESFDRDLADFISMENAQKHWKKYGKFYRRSFQDYVNAIVKKIEPPAAAHLDTD
jgi:hypothetical protein